MPYLRREGVSLYYEPTGGRPAPVMLLHGWCCDHTFLAPQSAHFARAGYAVDSLDFRGQGRSDKPEQPYPIGGFADDVAGTCGKLDLVKPILIGHSMGGIVAFDLAARWPELPGAVAMLDPAVVLPGAALAAVAPEAARLRAPDYAAELPRVMEAVVFLPTDDTGRKERILVIAPSLYLAADELSLRSDMERLRALLPGMLFGKTVGSGHFCQLEVPEQVNGMIDRFLAVAVRDAAARRADPDVAL